MSKMIIGRSSRANIRDYRRTLLTEIVASDPTKRWSARKLQAAAKQHAWFQEHMPNYGHMTAYRDMIYILKEMKQKREELAGDYIGKQLDITDDMLEDLLTRWEELNEVDLEDIPKGDRAGFVVNRAGLQGKLVGAIDKLLARQQTLLPIAVPKQLDVRGQVLQVNVEDFFRLRDQARQQIESSNADVLEGEVVDE